MEVGFPTCPPAILKIVVQSLVQWSRSPIFHLLLPILLQNAPIFIEISRQTFLLDLQYHDTIDKAISLFKVWFVESNIMKGKEEQACWQVLIITAIMINYSMVILLLLDLYETRVIVFHLWIKKGTNRRIEREGK